MRFILLHFCGNLNLRLKPVKSARNKADEEICFQFVTTVCFVRESGMYSHFGVIQTLQQVFKMYLLKDYEIGPSNLNIFCRIMQLSLSIL